jgi:hypothetical protein
LASEHNDAVVKKYYDMNMYGINACEALVDKLKIDCEFERIPHFAWTSDPAKTEIILKELDISRRLGIPCEEMDVKDLAKELPGTIGALEGIKFPNQAQFNPYKYFVTFKTKKETEEEDKAGSGIAATGKESGVADQPSAQVTLNSNAINIDMPLRSLRVVPIPASGEHEEGGTMKHDVDGQQIIVIAGDAIKQGDECETKQFYDDLALWAKQHFVDVEEILYRWSAMDYFSGDHIPFMGKLRVISLLLLLLLLSRSLLSWYQDDLHGYGIQQMGLGNWYCRCRSGYCLDSQSM